MIDLHIHTTYSDGDDSLINVLKSANDLKLEIISITDHNSCKGYYELDSFNVKEYFTGNIIIGCEFTTSFENKMIEVLGYGFDKEKVNKYLEDYCKDELIYKKTLYKECFNKIKDLGLIYNLSIDEDVSRNVSLDKIIYDELIKYPDNKDILGEDIFKSLSDFFRKGLTNKNSKIYVDFTKFKPNLKDIIDLVHAAGGIVFLAHPYQYEIDDLELFLERIYDENNLDGIECFYPSFTEEQTNYLLSFAHEKKLLISGGSDYHGTSRKDNQLGIGKGNLNIDKNIILNWGIDYYG